MIVPVTFDGLDIDWSFISRVEGGRLLDAYLPIDNDGQVFDHSGVTVATAVDLGARTRDELVGFGLAGELISRLEPYLGLQREVARRALQARPLRVTEAEAEQLDRAVATRIFAALRAAFDAATDRGAFARLPREAQTVLADVAYQYGPDLARVTPRLWSCVIDGRWDDAAAELRAFGDRYPRRRREEAVLVDFALGRGAL